LICLEFLDLLDVPLLFWETQLTDDATFFWLRKGSHGEVC
jgi:hypothetical protein